MARLRKDLVDRKVRSMDRHYGVVRAAMCPYCGPGRNTVKDTFVVLGSDLEDSDCAQAWKCRRCGQMWWNFHHSGHDHYAGRVCAVEGYESGKIRLLVEGREVSP